MVVSLNQGNSLHQTVSQEPCLVCVLPHRVPFFSVGCVANPIFCDTMVLHLLDHKASGTPSPDTLVQPWRTSVIQCTPHPERHLLSCTINPSCCEMETSIFLSSHNQCKLWSSQAIIFKCHCGLIPTSSSHCRANQGPSLGTSKPN